MKAIVVSDSHGDTDRLEELYHYYKEIADLFIHCGDSELPFDEKVMKPYVSVKGNCDSERFGYENERTFKKSDFTWFVTHGHLYNIKMTPLPLKYRAMEQKANLVCFGHTHQVTLFQEEGVVYLNPGSLSLPRIPSVATYCLLDWDEAQHLLKAEIKNLQHETLGNLSNTFFIL